MKILVAHEPVDFRKGIDGLVSLCRESLKQDPFLGTAFVFRNRSQTGVKILVYDGQGFWLCHKRLSKGRFRWWPSKGYKTAELEAFGLQVLVAAGNPDGACAPEPWRRLGSPGPESIQAGVPQQAYKVARHGDDHDIPKPGHHRPGRNVHPRPDRKIPGIQST